jgi:hypothetical protein
MSMMISTSMFPVSTINNKRTSSVLAMERRKESSSSSTTFCHAEMELFSQNLSKAISLSYVAGTADFDAVNNYAKDERRVAAANSSSNLEQARLSIVEAKRNLDELVGILTHY